MYCVGYYFTAAQLVNITESALLKELDRQDPRSLAGG